MRILAGSYKGRPLTAGKDLSIRPLTNRLKESIFNILQDFVAGRRVLDLFCGSGSFGLEALSRGARSIDFVEQDMRAIRVLRTNLANLQITPDRYKIYHADVLQFCRSVNPPYDLILSDPPFKFYHLAELIDAIMQNNLLEPEGLMIIHHEILNPIDPSSGQTFTVIDQRRYGRSLVSFIKLGVNHG